MSKVETLLEIYEGLIKMEAKDTDELQDYFFEHNFQISNFDAREEHEGYLISCWWLNRDLGDGNFWTIHFHLPLEKLDRIEEGDETVIFRDMSNNLIHTMTVQSRLQQELVEMIYKELINEDRIRG